MSYDVILHNMISYDIIIPMKTMSWSITKPCWSIIEIIDQPNSQ